MCLGDYVLAARLFDPCAALLESVRAPRGLSSARACAAMHFQQAPCGSCMGLLRAGATGGAQVEQVGHNFFIFRDLQSSQVKVLYKRKSRGYGVIVPTLD